ncbi:MAG TPA: GAF domain-containing protein, partial [Luteimonas sp.]|nr:GAF domain-containing protein [Luteimonas sp.]
MTDPASLDTDICAREPIHASGAIQPHGWLISCVLPDWTVRHASANIAALLDVDADVLVGRSLREHLDDDLLDSIAEVVGFSDSGAAPQRATIANIGPMAQLCDVGVHVQQGLVHIEIEAQPNRIRERTPTVVAQTMISRLASARDDDDFHQRIAAQVRLLTGYDRVMVYRFRHDDAGDVIAEARADDMEPYLGLRYPAGDIPSQARALYLRNRLRVIPDALYQPVPIVPATTATGVPLDLSQHALRSVSPVHLEYMRNMGVAASMSISIVSAGQLWGLVACHHRTPRAVPPGIRAAADLFGMFVSMRVSAREQEAAKRAEADAGAALVALAQRMDDAGGSLGVILQAFDLLQRAVPCDGAATWVDGHWADAGRTPGPADATRVIAWVERQDHTAMVATHRHGDWSDGAPDDGLAGVLA